MIKPPSKPGWRSSAEIIKGSASGSIASALVAHEAPWTDPQESADAPLCSKAESEAAAQAEANQAPICKIQIEDLGSVVYHRQPCPAALLDATEQARALFSPDASRLYWLLPAAAEPLGLPNPLAEPSPASSP